MTDFNPAMPLRKARELQLLILIGLYLTSLHSYVLFHTVIELFTILVALSIFTIAWNTRNFMQNSYLLFLSIAFVFIAGLDFLHTLSYKGMNVFGAYNPNYAPQLWIAARWVQAVSLIIALFWVKRQINTNYVFFIYALITVILVVSIFMHIFPECYIEGKGLTAFKKISEYLICIALMASLILLYPKRNYFDSSVFNFMAASVILTIAAELAFTFYIDVYGLSNLIGHYCRLIAFYLMYKAIIETGLTQPYSILFREIEKSKEQLEFAKITAESANHAKSQFLASMSHELRTPLNGILGYTQILKKESNLTERQKRAIDTIHRSGEHLLLMINDILDLSKIEAQKIELIPQNFHFHRFLKTIADIISVQAVTKSIGFECRLDEHLPIGICADEKRLRQILLNLLNNAVKFTLKGKVIFDVARIKNRIRFHIEDTGIGIPSEKIDEIFLPFHQVSDRRIRSEGTGLGLAISRQLIRLMGGELLIKTILNQGSKFWFDLNLSEALIEQTPIPSEIQKIVGYEGEPRRLLIVDDIPVNRMMLKDMLNRLNFEIAEAIDGHDAIEKAAQFHPHLILMDFFMPDLDGFEATRQIKNTVEGRKAIILGVSADVSSSSRLTGMNSGCDDFIPKPIDAEELLSKIAYYLKLNWIYGDEPAPEKFSAVPQEITPPPVKELELLHSMVERGNIGGIQQYSMQQKETSGEFSLFWKMIYQLAATYQLGNIKKRIEPYRKDNE